jgi:hypothetical protein
LDHAEKFQSLLRRMAPLTLWSAFRHFGTHFASRLLHVQIFMNDGPNLIIWDAQLLSYWFSQNPASGLSRLACEFDKNLRGGHCFVSSHRWKNHHTETVFDSGIWWCMFP